MKTHRPFASLGTGLALLAGLASVACGGSTTTFVSSWRAPTAEPLAMRGEKVAAVVMMQDDSMRRQAEDVLAREITHYGAKGIPMYQLLAGPAIGNEAAARAAVEAAGVKGAVVMRPMGTKQKVESHEVYSSPMYGGYWGGYYGYGWGSPYAPNTAYAIASNPHDVGTNAQTIYATAPASTVDTYTTTTEVVQVEVLVFSLKQNKLVWMGKSETTEPEKVDTFVTQLAAATVKELGGSGLLQSP